MLLEVPIDSDDPAEVAVILGYHLMGIVYSNRLEMRRRSIPPLYASGVTYQLEPHAPYKQVLRTCSRVLAERTGECKALSAWRCAELQEQARSEAEARGFNLQISWNDYDHDRFGVGLVPRNGIFRVYHAVVLYPNGAIEDPSKILKARAA